MRPHQFKVKAGEFARPKRVHCIQAFATCLCWGGGRCNFNFSSAVTVRAVQYVCQSVCPYCMCEQRMG